MQKTCKTPGKDPEAAREARIRALAGILKGCGAKAVAADEAEAALRLVFANENRRTVFVFDVDVTHLADQAIRRALGLPPNLEE